MFFQVLFYKIVQKNSQNCIKNIAKLLLLLIYNIHIRNWREFFLQDKYLRGGHISIGNRIKIISLYLELNLVALLLNNTSWNSRLFRQFFVHVWHIFSRLKFLQILPQSPANLWLTVVVRASLPVDPRRGLILE